MRKCVSSLSVLAMSFALLFSVQCFAADAGKSLVKANIPQIYGKAKDASEANSGLTIIHVQDAHGNVEAQENIQSIIKSLSEQGKVDAIMDEGSSRDYNFDGYKNLSPEDKQIIMDFYTKWGFTHAASRFAVLDKDIPVKGSEDQNLYDSNKQALIDSSKGKKDSVAMAEKIKGAMEALKLKLFDEQTRNFLQTLDDFQNDKVTLTAYSKTLQEQAEKTGVKWASYDNFNKVIESTKLEDSIDFAKIDRERLDMVDALESAVEKKISDEIVTKSLNYRLGRLSAGDYYDYLLAQAKSAKIDMKKYANVEKYAQLVKLYAVINDDALFAEADRLEKEIKAKLFKNDSQVNFDKYIKGLEILTKMVNLQMTRADLASYNENKPQAKQMLAFLKEQSKALNLGIEIDDVCGKIDENLTSNEKFYEIAMKRDEVMVEKTLAMMDERGFKTVVLVAGGFHSEGIIKALKAKAISHMIVTPRITNPDAPNYWLQNMLGEETEGSKLINDANVATQTNAQTDTNGDKNPPTQNTIRWTLDKLKALEAGNVKEISDATKAEISENGNEITISGKVGVIQDASKATSDIFAAQGLKVKVVTEDQIAGLGLEINGNPAVRKGNVVVITQAMDQLMSQQKNFAEAIARNESAESKTDGSAQAIADVNAKRSKQDEIIIQSIGLLNQALKNGSTMDYISKVAANINVSLAANPFKGNLDLTSKNQVEQFKEVINSVNMIFNQAVNAAANISPEMINSISISDNQILIKEDTTAYSVFSDDKNLQDYVGSLGSLLGIDEASLNKAPMIRAVTDVDAAAQVLKTAFPGLADRIIIASDVKSADELKKEMKTNEKNCIVLISNKDSVNVAKLLAKAGNEVKAFIKTSMPTETGDMNARTFFKISDNTPDSVVAFTASKMFAKVGAIALANELKATGIANPKLDEKTIAENLNQGIMPELNPTMKALFEAMSAAVVFAVAA